MNTIAIEDATDSLAEFAAAVREQPLLVTRAGKAVAALVPIEADADLESIALSTNPKFMAMIQRSRASCRDQGAIPADEIRRHFPEQAAKE